MIKVIKNPTKYQINCPSCNAKLEFELGDVKEGGDGRFNSFSYIDCPVESCMKTIHINNLHSLEVIE